MNTLQYIAVPKVVALPLLFPPRESLVLPSYSLLTCLLSGFLSALDKSFQINLRFSSCPYFLRLLLIILQISCVSLAIVKLQAANSLIGRKYQSKSSICRSLSPLSVHSPTFAVERQKLHFMSDRIN